MNYREAAPHIFNAEIERNIDEVVEAMFTSFVSVD